MSVLTGRFYLYFLSLRKTWERQTFQNQKQFRTPVRQQYTSAWRRHLLSPLPAGLWGSPWHLCFPGLRWGCSGCSAQAPSNSARLRESSVMDQTRPRAWFQVSRPSGAQLAVDHRPPARELPLLCFVRLNSSTGGVDPGPRSVLLAGSWLSWGLSSSYSGEEPTV